MSRLLLWATLFGVVLLAAGCGGSSGGDTGEETAGDQAESISKSEWIEQADAICTTEQEEEKPIEAELEAEGEKAETADQLKKLGGITRELLALVDKETEDIRALPVPAGDEATIETMLDKVQSAVPLGEEFADALESGDVAEIERTSQKLEKNSESAKGMAQSYGLKVCGSAE